LRERNGVDRVAEGDAGGAGDGVPFRPSGHRVAQGDAREIGERAGTGNEETRAAVRGRLEPRVAFQTGDPASGSRDRITRARTRGAGNRPPRTGSGPPASHRGSGRPRIGRRETGDSGRGGREASAGVDRRTAQRNRGTPRQARGRTRSTRGRAHRHASGPVRPQDARNETPGPGGSRRESRCRTSAPQERARPNQGRLTAPQLMRSERMNAIVTLTTDFEAGEYIGAMKGAILTVDPDATVVDIDHAIRPHNIRHGAYVLYSAVPYYP